ncbi:hypothetical protein ACFWMR_19415 [Amycolatopsis thailandensis]|uniref:hypothetical protein n=1 Tax=Amycolatopsis thailandensis TaxID=589330 RepID=UPI00364F73D2
MDLAQGDVHQRFVGGDQSGWTVVSDSWREEQANGGIFCALAPPAARDEILARTAWDLRKSDFRPGFSQRWGDGETETVYEPGGGRDGFEALVIHRMFHQAFPDVTELSQEFRLFHNLFWEEASSSFLKPNDDGTFETAVKIKGSRVEVRTKLLRQYQAARQLLLVLFIDSIRHGKTDDTLPKRSTWRDEHTRAELFPGGDDSSRPPFTRYLAKRILTPPAVDKSGIWPYEAEDDHYPEFIIGMNEDGDDIRHTCNEDALSDYFGGNPDAPQYLTPVYFRREVLKKYYDKPELYTVSDGRLACAALWGLDIDNSHADKVIVFLGDLGKGLPRQERDYWLSFNVAPESAPSDTFMRRSLLAQFAEPSAEDLQVRSKYSSFAGIWEPHFGWRLFKQPAEADTGLLQRLRLPLDNSQAEFEGAVAILTKLFVDALATKSIQLLLAEKVENEGSISKLSRWMTQEGYPYVDRDIAFLRSLQEVRSKAVAHWKGNDYEKTMTKIFGSARGRDAVLQFFRDALAMLSGMEDWITARSMTAT